MNFPSNRTEIFRFTSLLLALWASSPAIAQTSAAVLPVLRLSLPVDYQVHQRTTRAEGKIIVAGALPQSSTEASIVETRLVGSGAVEPWQNLVTLTPGQAQFRAERNAAAGGWYRLEVRSKRQDTVTAEAVVEHVGVGEVFVVVGQSNSSNHGEEKQLTKTGLVAALARSKWQLAHDPQPGASGAGGSFIPPFADAIAERFKVPVGVVAAGVGSTSVREWLPAASRFPNPPTLTRHVRALLSGEWESKGILFTNLTLRLRQLGPGGFRAVLWHQGESDANQKDASRTLPGHLYQKYMERFILECRRDVGWDFPWFVALVSYHTPDDAGSPEIRAAQRALWKPGLALEGPDSDALTGDLRNHDGKGVHFSGKGLREHAARWVEKVAPWLEQQLALATTAPTKPSTAQAMPPPKLDLPGDKFMVEGRPAFVFLPAESKRSKPQPWIFYAPTLPAYPDEAERWMHEQFLAAGVAVAGVDAGEAYGSPQSHVLFDALYRELTERRGFAPKPCLFGRSRGGLWVSSWAIADPGRVAGIISIYPVFDFRTYPGITNAAPAYGLSPAGLEARAAEFNPIERVAALAKARVPAAFIHGDMDKVVPLKQNSGEFARLYQANGAETLVKLIVLEGQGHNLFEAFFHSQELVDFAIDRARAGATR
ncbi:MAG: prolyl oligopeptidase family serine peptidase [Verrucomicrobiales bacterium]|nr:prolyl oligopeptidase family serine peptidase [Verrucomicrobiales bacterium]